jgi:ABC-2 type transport system permease protein
MIDQFRSELLKLRTTRTMLMLLGVAAGLTLLGVLIEGVSPSIAELGQENTQRTMFSAAGSGSVFLATLAGLLAVTTEFRYGTIRTTLLVEPRRRVVLGAKLGAAALAGVLIGVICVSVAFGAGLAVLGARNVDVALTGAHTATLIAGPIAGAGLGALLGVAVGTSIRNQVGAIVALAAYAIAVDAVLFSAIPSIGRYLPGKAGDALTGLPTAHLLTPAAGAAVLAAWALAFIAAATVRNDRSDI